VGVKIGVIAEEQNDVDVLYRLTCKLLPENSFSFSKFIGHGCGKLRRKCRPWAKNLIARGCSHLVVLHDLDSRDESSLRKELLGSIANLPFSGHVIIIPVHEIEAWLLCDALALKTAFNMRRTPRVPARPERIQSPKEHLRDLVWRSCQKRYVNTIHNGKIARFVRLESLEACPSFTPYPQFVVSLAPS